MHKAIIRWKPLTEAMKCFVFLIVGPANEIRNSVVNQIVVLERIKDKKLCNVRSLVAYKRRDKPSAGQILNTNLIC
jgi:hypothetical protein